MNASQVRAKARMAMKRREEEIEIEEIEGGELNLVPYLDIVTNIMLFLLATVTSGQLIGTINSTLPEYASPDSGSGKPPDTPQTEQLQMVVAVTKSEILMFSLSNLEGSLEAPKLKIRAEVPGKKYDYSQLTTAATEIVERRWKGLRILNTLGPEPKCLAPDKSPLPMTACRPLGATDIFLMVDGEIPYEVVIGTMDALRQNDKIMDSGHPLVLFPGVIFSSGVTQGAQ